MPRNPERPLSAEEQRFIRHYVRERDIEKAERKSRLRAGEGMKLYRRAQVRADIERRLEEIEREQARVDALDLERRRETLDQLLDPELVKTIKLDAEKHGAIKLKALALGLVVSGRIRQGNTEALNRAQSSTSGVSVYESVFVRQHIAESSAAARSIPPAGPAPHTATPSTPSPSRAPVKGVIRVY